MDYQLIQHTVDQLFVNKYYDDYINKLLQQIELGVSQKIDQATLNQKLVQWFTINYQNQTIQDVEQFVQDVFDQFFKNVIRERFDFLFDTHRHFVKTIDRFSYIVGIQFFTDLIQIPYFQQQIFIKSTYQFNETIIQNQLVLNEIQNAGILLYFRRYQDQKFPLITYQYQDVYKMQIMEKVQDYNIHHRNQLVFINDCDLSQIYSVDNQQNIELQTNINNCIQQYQQLQVNKCQQFNLFFEFNKIQVNKCKILSLTFCNYNNAMQSFFDTLTNDANYMQLIQYFDVQNNNIVNINFMKNLNTNLIFLKISHNNIHDVDVIQKFKYLTYLCIHENQIADISSLKYLVNLKELTAYKNKITNIDVLYYLQKLEIIDLDYNDIQDISVFKNLQNLKYLNLSNNKIKDISPISKNYQLVELRFNNNKVENIYPLRKLIRLQVLELTLNPIHDYYPLLKLFNLRMVHCYDHFYIGFMRQRSTDKKNLIVKSKFRAKEDFFNVLCEDSKIMQLLKHHREEMQCMIKFNQKINSQLQQYQYKKQILHQINDQKKLILDLYEQCLQ